MLFADGYWEVKNLNDTIAIVGLVLTLFSIWLSWWLAKLDIRKRIEEAERETVAKLASLLLQTDVSETFRYLEHAREACRSRHWVRAIDRCELAMHRIPKFRSLPGLDDQDRALLGEAVDQLRLLIRYIEQIMDPEKKPIDLTSNKIGQLDSLITLLGAIEGRLRASGLRV